jgi:hypothetical protein
MFIAPIFRIQLTNSYPEFEDSPFPRKICHHLPDFVMTKLKKCQYKIRINLYMGDDLQTAFQKIIFLK